MQLNEKSVGEKYVGLEVTMWRIAQYTNNCTVNKDPKPIILA